MKLTNAHRQDIIQACVKATFSKRDDALKLSQAALGDALYQSLHGAAAKIADKLPDGWCSVYGSVRISMAGFSHAMPDRHPDEIPLSKHCRFPAYRGTSITVNPDHPLYGQADALLGEFNALRGAKAELENSLRGIVYGVNTLAKLQEV